MDGNGVDNGEDGYGDYMDDYRVTRGKGLILVSYYRGVTW